MWLAHSPREVIHSGKRAEPAKKGAPRSGELAEPARPEGLWLFMAMRNSPSLRLHIRPERIRHGVDLCQILRRGPDIPVGQSTGGGGALPAAKLPNLVRKYVLCGGQGLVQRGLHPGQYKRVAIVTGSEGGFSVEEAEAAKAAGAVTVGLGPRILRCETAPLAALTSVMLLTGNLE